MSDCLTTNEHIHAVIDATIEGAVVGYLGEGLGALPGAGVGFIYGAGHWGYNSLVCTGGNAAVKNLPSVTIDGAEKK